MTRPGKLLVIVIPLLLMSSAGAAAWFHGGGVPRGKPAVQQDWRAPRRCVSLPVRGFTGAAVPGPVPGDLAVFTRAAGVAPSVLEYYADFGDSFDVNRAGIALTARAVPLLQWNPWKATLSAIAAGKYDAYLLRFASSVRRFRCPLLLSFAHEMNGNWYRWGYEHVTPAAYIAAWRHIHTVLTKAGARNITWLWTVNRESARKVVSPLRLWWPGRAYVDWVGINGKFPVVSDTFAYVFAQSLASVRALGRMPVVLTETGIAAGPHRPAQIRDLFAGMARNPAIIGMVWFNLNAMHGDWRLQGDPASDAVFRQQARNYR